MDNPFRRGDRVKLSEKAIRANIRVGYEDVKGTIAANPRPETTTCRVHWDGTKAPGGAQIHFGYLEKEAKV